MTEPTTLALPSFVDGAGPPLVMLGGGTHGALPFAPHAQLLANDFQVVRLQTLNVERAQRGEALPADYSVRLESTAMTRALDELGLVDALNIVGWSYGGVIALDFALTHQRRVRTLTLFEPPALWVVPQDELRTSPDMRPIYELGLDVGPGNEPTDEQHVRFLSELGAPGVRPPSPGDPEWEDWAIRRSALGCLPAISYHLDDPARLRDFRVPVLVMYGVKTVPFHLRISDILARTLPLAERVELASGHLGPLTRRDEFIAGIRRFVALHPDAPGIGG